MENEILLTEPVMTEDVLLGEEMLTTESVSDPLSPESDPELLGTASVGELQTADPLIAPATPTGVPVNRSALILGRGFGLVQQLWPEEEWAYLEERRGAMQAAPSDLTPPPDPIRQGNMIGPAVPPVGLPPSQPSI